MFKLMLAAALLHLSYSVVLPRAPPPSPCPSRQVWDPCIPPSVPECGPRPPRDRLVRRPPCIAGCRCNDDYPVHAWDFDRSIKKCVRTKQDCCPANLIWRSCTGSFCNNNCENKGEMSCTADCVAKCVCPQNKPILHNGKCIKKNKCPEECYESHRRLCFCDKCKNCKKSSSNYKCIRNQFKNNCKKNSKKFCCCCPTQFCGGSNPFVADT